MMSSLTEMQSDMTEFMTLWGESLTRQRLSVTYDTEGKPVKAWANEAITGDYQALTGSDKRLESGRTYKSESKIYVLYDADILAGDRVIRSGVYLDVNYVEAHEDHKVAYIRRLRSA